MTVILFTSFLACMLVVVAACTVYYLPLPDGSCRY
jgi:hypothetical protein